MNFQLASRGSCPWEQAASQLGRCIALGNWNTTTGSKNILRNLRGNTDKQIGNKIVRGGGICRTEVNRVVDEEKGRNCLVKPGRGEGIHFCVYTFIPSLIYRESRLYLSSPRLTTLSDSGWKLLSVVFQTTPYGRGSIIIEERHEDLAIEGLTF